MFKPENETPVAQCFCLGRRYATGSLLVRCVPMGLLSVVLCLGGPIFNMLAFLSMCICFWCGVPTMNMLTVLIPLPRGMGLLSYSVSGAEFSNSSGLDTRRFLFMSRLHKQVLEQLQKGGGRGSKCSHCTRCSLSAECSRFTKCSPFTTYSFVASSQSSQYGTITDHSPRHCGDGAEGWQGRC